MSKTLIPYRTDLATLTLAKALARAYNMRLTHKAGEFCLVVPWQGNNYTYYTDDLQDAIGTMKAQQTWKLMNASLWETSDRNHYIDQNSALWGKN